MATFTIESETLTVHLSRAEKVAALRGDVRVPRSAVTGVTVEPDGLAAVRGIRAPGLAIPARTKIGTWRGRGHRAFVCVRSGEPAVRITLSGTGDDELLVSTPEANDIAQHLARGG